MKNKIIDFLKKVIKGKLYMWKWKQHKFNFFIDGKNVESRRTSPSLPL